MMKRLTIVLLAVFALSVVIPSASADPPDKQGDATIFESGHPWGGEGGHPWGGELSGSDPGFLDILWIGVTTLVLV